MKNSSINKPLTQAKTEAFINEWSYKKECDFCNFNTLCREAEYLVSAIQLWRYRCIKYEEQRLSLKASQNKLTYYELIKFGYKLLKPEIEFTNKSYYY